MIELTDAEIAYLRRAMFMTQCLLTDGEDSLYARGPRAGFDLALLAQGAGILEEVLEKIFAVVEAGGAGASLEPEFPKSPFPWESLDALHQRRLDCERGRGPTA